MVSTGALSSNLLEDIFGRERAWVSAIATPVGITWCSSYNQFE